MRKEKRECVFFKHGKCKFGNRCRYLHVLDNPNPHMMNKLRVKYYKPCDIATSNASNPSIDPNRFKSSFAHAAFLLEDDVVLAFHRTAVVGSFKYKPKTEDEHPMIIEKRFPSFEKVLFYENSYTIREVICNGSIPSPRRNSSLCLSKDVCILFGGFTHGYKKSPVGYRNDLYKFNINTCTWSFVNQRGDIPCPRCSHKVVTNKEMDMMYLYGGVICPAMNDRVFIDDLYSLDLNYYIWKKIVTFPKIERPPPSMLHGFALDEENNRLVLFGGFVQERREPQIDASGNVIIFGNPVLVNYPPIYFYSLDEQKWEKKDYKVGELCPERDISYDTVSHKNILFAYTRLRTLKEHFILFCDMNDFKWKSCPSLWNKKVEEDKMIFAGISKRNELIGINIFGILQKWDLSSNTIFRKSSFKFEEFHDVVFVFY